MKQLILGLTLAAFAAAPLGVIATTEAKEGPSCAGVISRAAAHEQLRDEANELVQFIADILGIPPGQVKSFIAQFHGEDFDDCVDQILGDL
jgi:hypothetical protein